MNEPLRPIWHIQIDGPARYLQCEGDLLNITERKLKAFAQRFQLERIGKGVFRRKIENTPESQSAIANLLTETRTCIDFHKTFHRNAEHFFKLIQKSTPENIRETVEKLNGIILKNFEVRKTNQDFIEKLKMLCNAMEAKHPELAEFFTKIRYQEALLKTVELHEIITNFNDHAQKGLMSKTVDNTPLAPIFKPFNHLAGILFEHCEAKTILSFEPIADSIEALEKFYRSKISFELKQQYALLLLLKIIPLYCAQLRVLVMENDIVFTQKNPVIEKTLNLTCEIAKHILASHPTADLPKTDALSFQFAALGLLRKYYSDTQQWKLFDQHEEFYFHLLRKLPAEAFNNNDKEFIELDLKAYTALIRKNIPLAMACFDRLCQRFWTWAIERNDFRNLPDIISTGIRLAEATFNTPHAVETAYYIQTLLTQFDQKRFDTCDNSAIATLEDCLHQLETQHIKTLLGCLEYAQQQEPVTFSVRNFTIFPNHAEDMPYFISAFKRLGIAHDENCFRLTRPERVHLSQLEAALRAVNHKKTKAEAKKAEETKSGSPSSDKENPPAQPFAVSPATSLHKIGTEKKKAHKPKRSAVQSQKANPAQRAIPAQQANPVQKPAVAVRALLRVNFGERFGEYNEALGDNQKIIALQSDHYPFGKYFVYIDGEFDKKFSDVLKRGQIVGSQGQEGVKFFKMNGSGQKVRKLKIKEDEFLVGEIVCVTANGCKLICFNRLMDHKAEQRLVKGY